MACIGFAVILVQEAGKVEQYPQPSEDTVLHLSFRGGIVEAMSDDPLEQIDLESFKLVQRRTLDSVLLGIREGADDERVVGLYLDLQGRPGTWSQMNEIRKVVMEFRESGKWVMAYGQTLSPSFYHVATAANTIAMDPVGQLPLDGLGMEMLFFGRMLEKWDVEPRAIRARDNNYKSAIEPFTLDGLSEENRLQLKELLDQRWRHFTERVESSRSLDPKSLDLYAKNLQPAEPKAAKELGLVDALLYEEEVRKRISDKVDGHGASCTCHLMKVEEYARSQKLVQGLDGNAYGKGVGYIVAEGAIMTHVGSGSGFISPKRLKSRLKEMQEDDRIASLVLRINSPGGSAQASEWLWRAIRKFSKEKPVVVSLGPMAASGGYYMASAGNLIVADPLTLTGSIGVFGLIPRVDKALEEHLDITVDRVHTHPELAMSLLGPISGPAMARIQNQVDEVYRLFLDRVSKGRGLDMEKVKSLSQGRVWTGRDAVREGLADQEGGLLQAIDLAYEQADLYSGAPIYTDQPGDIFEMLTKNLEDQFSTSTSFSEENFSALPAELSISELKDWLGSRPSSAWTFAMLPWWNLHR